MKTILCSAALGLALAGCSTTTTTPDTTSSRARTAEQSRTTGAARAGALTDAQILDVVTVLNRGEILAADAVEGKLVSTQAKDFARMMKGMHEEGMDKARGVMTATGLRNEEAPMSSKLRNDVQTVVGKLQGASGGDVDRMYLQSQIDMHQDALRVIDDQLLPNAKNEQVITLLRDMRPTVAQHLDRARELLRTVGSNEMSSGR
jgi:putative membrane protein